MAIDDFQSSVLGLPADIAREVAESSVMDVRVSRGMDRSITASVANANRVQSVFVSGELVPQCAVWLYTFYCAAPQDNRDAMVQDFVLRLSLELLRDPRGGKLAAERWSGQDDGFKNVVEKCVDATLADLGHARSGSTETDNGHGALRERVRVHVSKIIRILADHAAFSETPSQQ